MNFSALPINCWRYSLTWNRDVLGGVSEVDLFHLVSECSTAGEAGAVICSGFLLDTRVGKVLDP